MLHKVKGKQHLSVKLENFQEAVGRKEQNTNSKNRTVQLNSTWRFHNSFTVHMHCSGQYLDCERQHFYVH